MLAKKARVLTLAMAAIFALCSQAQAQVTATIKVTVVNLDGTAVGNATADPITVIVEDGDGNTLKINPLAGGGTTISDTQIKGADAGVFAFTFMQATATSSKLATLSFTRGQSMRNIPNILIQSTRTDNLNITIGAK